MKVFIIIFLNFLVVRAHSQITDQPAQYMSGSKDLRAVLLKTFNEEVKNSKFSDCVKSTLFTKFFIDSTGKVTDINFSSPNGTPQIFKEILYRILLKTNGNWQPSLKNGTPVKSEPFILPLIVELEAGCILKQAPYSKNLTKETPDFISTDLLNLLEFDNKIGDQNNQLKCILLKPLHIVSNR